ncbi:hypothetical protein [Nonomuraea sp. NPDC005650]|uniref:hypothetical protein n=1 Tax=Nonomuraea sp. NPDC005650 TaxID=3157045 RepID=UPI0033AF67CE
MIVEVCIGPGHPDITDFEVEGYNQNNDYVKTPMIDIWGNPDIWRCRVVGGYFWKGTISVHFYNFNGVVYKYLGTRLCYVGVSGPDPAQCQFP